MALKILNLATECDYIAPNGDILVSKIPLFLPNGDNLVPNGDSVAPNSDNWAPKYDNLGLNSDILAQKDGIWQTMATLNLVTFWHSTMIF